MLFILWVIPSLSNFEPLKNMRSPLTCFKICKSQRCRRNFRFFRSLSSPVVYVRILVGIFIALSTVSAFYRPTDEDFDGLPDVVEVELGTDPDIADTDDDGQSDGEEVLETGTAPLSCVESLVPSPMGAEFSACIGTRLTQYACDASAGDAVGTQRNSDRSGPCGASGDEQTQSCGFGEHYGTDAFLGTPTFVVLLAETGVDFAGRRARNQQMKTELDTGYDIDFVIVNGGGGVNPVSL